MQIKVWYGLFRVLLLIVSMRFIDEKLRIPLKYLIITDERSNKAIYPSDYLGCVQAYVVSFWETEFIKVEQHGCFKKETKIIKKASSNFDWGQQKANSKVSHSYKLWHTTIDLASLGFNFRNVNWKFWMQEWGRTHSSTCSYRCGDHRAITAGFN